MQASVLCKLAKLRRRRGDLAAAQTLYEKALGGALYSQNGSAETEIRLGLGQVLSARGELKSAYEELFRALELSQTLELKRVTCSVHRALAEMFEKASCPSEALKHLKESYALDKQLLTKRSRERSQLLAAQFELEKITRDAEISHLKNVELARANGALEATNAQNAALLEQLREQAAQLEQQTREDVLTGLYNRRHLEGAMRSKAFETARRHREALTVVLIDLDNFKLINDTLSHQVGDEVLRTVARIFSRFVRSADVIARYGGEEFALVLPKTHAVGARAVCERICEEVAAHPWSALHPELKVTVSIGLSDDLSVKDHEKLLALADDKLYEAKRAGKNRVVF